MDPNKLPSKIIFSIFDKILIGLIAAGALLIFQDASKRSQVYLNEINALNKTLLIDKLLKEKELLISFSGKYFILVEEIKNIGQASSNQALELGKIRDKIKIVLFNLYAIEGTIKKESDNYIISLNKLNLMLISKPNPPNEIDSKLQEVQKNYISVLERTNNVCEKIVRKPFEKVRQEMGWF